MQGIGVKYLTMFNEHCKALKTYKLLLKFLGLHVSVVEI